MTAGTIGSASVVTLLGEWGMVHRDELRALFEPRYGSEELIVDLRHCTYFDSSVLSALARLRSARRALWAGWPARRVPSRANIVNGRRTADEIVGVSPQFVMAHVGRFSVVHAVGRLDDAGGSKLEEVIREAAAQSDGPLIVSFLECEPVAAESCQTVLLRLFKLLPTRLRVVAPPESALRRHLELLPAGRVPPLHDGFRQAILGVCDSHEILRDRPQASGAAKSGCSAQEPGQAPARTVPERRAI